VIELRALADTSSMRRLASSAIITVWRRSCRKIA
jgi:hypothetical protein